MKLGYDTTIYAARSGSDDYLWSFLVDFVRIITSESFSRMTSIDFPFRHSFVCFACFCNISLEKRVQAGGEKLNIEASDKISSNSCHALMLAGIKARIQRREKKAKRSKKIHHLFHSSVPGLRDNSVISLRKRLKWMNSFSPDLLLQVHPHRDWVSGIHPPATSGFKLRSQVKCKVLGIRKQSPVQQRIELIGVADLFNFSVFEKQSTSSRHQRGVCLNWGRETSLAELRIQFYCQWKLFQVPFEQIVWLTSKRDKQPLNVVYSKLGCNKLRNFHNHFY